MQPEGSLVAGRTKPIAPNCLEARVVSPLIPGVLPAKAPRSFFALCSCARIMRAMRHKSFNAGSQNSLKVRALLFPRNDAYFDLTKTTFFNFFFNVNATKEM